jgi:hypothetical protein
MLPKKKRKKENLWARGAAQAVECLPWKHEAPSITPQKEEKKEKSKRHFTTLNIERIKSGR